MWAAVLLHCMRMSPVCAQLRVGVHCALRLPHHYVLSRVTALTLLRFGGTMLLAPHDSA